MTVSQRLLGDVALTLDCLLAHYVRLLLLLSLGVCRDHFQRREHHLMGTNLGENLGTDLWI